MSQQPMKAKAYSSVSVFDVTIRDRRLAETVLSALIGPESGNHNPDKLAALASLPYQYDAGVRNVAMLNRALALRCDDFSCTPGESARLIESWVKSPWDEDLMLAVFCEARVRMSVVIDPHLEGE